MECFSSVTAASQSEPVLFAERLVDVCEQIQAWRNSRQNFQVYSFKNVLGHLALRKTFISGCIYPRKIFFMDFKESWITCKQPVRPRQKGIQFDGCFHWNHRTCNTGMLPPAIWYLNITNLFFIKSQVCFVLFCFFVGFVCGISRIRCFKLTTQKTVFTNLFMIHKSVFWTEENQGSHYVINQFKVTSTL